MCTFKILTLPKLSSSTHPRLLAGLCNSPGLMYFFVRFPEVVVLFPDILSESEGLLSWVEEMPEDRFTTLPSGGFSVENPNL